MAKQVRRSKGRRRGLTTTSMRILNRLDWSESKPISAGVTSVVLRRRSIL
ncbi:MAG: hypothetical protein ACI906_005172 [Candidatus Latescibacterota bacterium]|jgi:hypothetical protein